MANDNKPGSLNAITILSGGLAVMGTMPLAPKVMNGTAELTYRALVESYGTDLASFGMLIHAGASFVVTFFALLLILRIGFSILIQKISRFSNRSGPSGW